MFNKKNMKIFTQSWRPDSTSQPKGIVAMLVIYITNIQYVVSDCIKFFDSVKASNPKLPAFLYGESLGGAISILICLKQGYAWDGLILSSAMCGISAKFKPMWPLEKLLPLAALSYKEEWKRRLVANNPNRRNSEKPPPATALEFLRFSEYIRMHCYDLKVPFVMVHGEDDFVCDFRSASFVHESASSKDKTLKTFPGMWHVLIGEPKENVELVFETILSWLEDHAAKTKTITS
uniref:Serine aminopeptidase S33 domain-containing protein n=1 Tax=Populus trichocarpa TaxID=3694 RepID=A0A3N7FWF3_POPTR